MKFDNSYIPFDECTLFDFFIEMTDVGIYGLPWVTLDNQSYSQQCDIAPPFHHNSHDLCNSSHEPSIIFTKMPGSDYLTVHLGNTLPLNLGAYTFGYNKGIPFYYMGERVAKAVGTNLLEQLHIMDMDLSVSSVWSESALQDLCSHTSSFNKAVNVIDIQGQESLEPTFIMSIYI